MSSGLAVRMGFLGQYVNAQGVVTNAASFPFPGGVLSPPAFPPAVSVSMVSSHAWPAEALPVFLIFANQNVKMVSQSF